MSEERVGDWIQTYTGRMFWPLDPRKDEISELDIAHSLSLQCRFAGHCKAFYSVAQHSVMVSRNLPNELKAYGLLHDAAEAYLVDIPRPLKRSLQLGVEYAKIEDRLMIEILRRFRLNVNIPHEVKSVDCRMLMTEKRDLMSWPESKWSETALPFDFKIEPWSWKKAKSEFLLEASKLLG